MADGACPRAGELCAMGRSMVKLQGSPFHPAPSKRTTCSLSMFAAWMGNEKGTLGPQQHCAILQMSSRPFVQIRAECCSRARWAACTEIASTALLAGQQGVEASQGQISAGIPCSIPSASLQLGLPWHCPGVVMFSCRGEGTAPKAPLSRHTLCTAVGLLEL